LKTKFAFPVAPYGAVLFLAGGVVPRGAMAAAGPTSNFNFAALVTSINNESNFENAGVPTDNLTL